MNSKTQVGIALTAVLFGLVFAPAALSDAFAQKGVGNPTLGFGADTDGTFFLRGGLTSPADDKPFGGISVGSYFIRILDAQDVQISALFFNFPSEGNVYEGWLVDVDTGYKLSLGQFTDQNVLEFKQTIVNPQIYDVLVISEEPEGDTDPSPDTPVGGVKIDKQAWN